MLYTAHPELSLPEWTCYTALTIQNAAGDVLFAGSAGEYQNFLFPANGEYKAELTAWRVPKGGVITQFEGGSTGQLRKNLGLERPQSPPAGTGTASGSPCRPVRRWSFPPSGWSRAAR